MKKYLKTICLVALALVMIPMCFGLLTACEKKGTVTVKTVAELKEALAGDKEIIKLKDDITLEEGIVLSRKVTLDLNGKTLTGNGCDGIIKVVTNGDLTITGNGKMVANEVDRYAMVLWATEEGKITIENGTFRQNVSKVVDDKYDSIYASVQGQITILGGDFESVIPGWTLNVKNEHYPNANIIVKGGTFKGYNPAGSNTDEHGKGNTTNFVADGFKAQLKAGTTDVYEVVNA